MATAGPLLLFAGLSLLQHRPVECSRAADLLLGQEELPTFAEVLPEQIHVLLESLCRLRRIFTSQGCTVTRILTQALLHRQEDRLPLRRGILRLKQLLHPREIQLPKVRVGQERP